MVTRIQSPQHIGRISNFACVGNGAALSVSTNSSAVQLPTLPDESPATDVMIVNTGSVAVFVTFGSTSPTAAIPTAGTPANGICILANSTMILDKSSYTYIAAITASSTATIYIYQGFGS